MRAARARTSSTTMRRHQAFAAMTTDSAGRSDMREALRYIYAQIFVEYLTKNPLYNPGEAGSHARSSHKI